MSHDLEYIYHGRHDLPGSDYSSDFWISTNVNVCHGLAFLGCVGQGLDKSEHKVTFFV